jgi:uncharacterized membrane protein
LDIETRTKRMRWIRALALSAPGLAVGVLFFAASLTPSLVPRSPLIQGALSGVSFAAGYGLGVLSSKLSRILHLRPSSARAQQVIQSSVLVACLLIAIAALWWASGWQARLRAVMGMPAEESAGPLIIAATAFGVFCVLLTLARSFRFLKRRLSLGLGRYVPGPQATLLAVLATAALFWSVGNGVLVSRAMRSLDAVYQELDARFEESSPQPTRALKTGGPDSLVAWSGLGRRGRQMIAAGPDRQQIEASTGALAVEPLRVYVGLNSAETPADRARLALAELIRIGGFDRANLVIVTPTGTGWVDPESQAAMEYVLRGDVASVAVQYSYLASWIALLAAPDYGVETAREVFAAVYNHWRDLPKDKRPKLYLHGLSLGAFNSDLSNDLFQVIGDPYQGVLWSGPPFNSRTWSNVTAHRNPGTPAWLPDFRDGSVIRFTAQKDHLGAAPAPWGSYRVIFLQYASDAVTFFDPHALWRKPDWMAPPRGPDVSPDLIWIPVVTFLQLTFDMMLAVIPPKGHGHVYAFEHYVDCWASLTDAPGWTAASLQALKEKVGAERK